MRIWSRCAPLVYVDYLYEVNEHYVEQVAYSLLNVSVALKRLGQHKGLKGQTSRN